MQLLLCLLLAVTSSWAQSPIRFDGFQVYRVTPHTAKQLEVLRELEKHSQGFNFWTDVSMAGQPVDIMVPPHLKYDFQDLITLQKLNGKVWIENVQELIDNEKRVAPRNTTNHDWKRYQTLDEIYAFLDSLVEKYPGIVTPLVGGKSYEGREIRGVKVSFGPGKKGVFIEGGIHAEEWICPATVTYILNELLSNTNSSVRAIVESRDWHMFFPVSTQMVMSIPILLQNRLWRKTRQPYGFCYGADPNRNWDYHWMDGGASNNPCSQTFAGSSPFSEIETKTLSEYISSVANSLDTYLAFHSYGQILLISFGHQGLEVPENNEELHRIGKEAAKSLAVRHGTQYRVENMPIGAAIVSGLSIDWALGKHRHIRIAYTYGQRDEGQYGFLLPPEEIIPSGEETFDSLVTIISEANASL